jgi:hypothetical protein
LFAVPRPHRPKAAVAAAAAGVFALALMGSAAATTPPVIITVQINKAASIAATKAVTVGGVLKCTKGDRYRIVAALVQKASGMFAAASYPDPAAKKSCSGGSDKWTFALKPKTGAFKAGPAEVCVLMSTQNKSVGATGLTQSCNTLTLAAAK